MRINRRIASMILMDILRLPTIHKKISNRHASTHIPCGLQTRQAGEAHGICALG
jgi:hypothetical protein